MHTWKYIVLRVTLRSLIRASSVQIWPCWQFPGPRQCSYIGVYTYSGPASRSCKRVVRMASSTGQHSDGKKNPIRRYDWGSWKRRRINFHVKQNSAYIRGARRCKFMACSVNLVLMLRHGGAVRCHQLIDHVHGLHLSFHKVYKKSGVGSLQGS